MPLHCRLMYARVTTDGYETVPRIGRPSAGRRGHLDGVINARVHEGGRPNTGTAKALVLEFMAATETCQQGRDGMSCSNRDFTWHSVSDHLGAQNGRARIIAATSRAPNCVLVGAGRRVKVIHDDRPLRAIACILHLRNFRSIGGTLRLHNHDANW